MTNQTTPAHRLRSDGWTPLKMRQFLEALATSSSVTDACLAVDMSRQSAYRLRAQHVGQPFDVAWEAALEHGLRQLAHTALERAVKGVVEPVFYHGEKIGERVRYSERLLMFMIANPQRVGRNHLARDHAAHTWEGLMQRIEHGPPTWDETPPRSKKACARAEATLVADVHDFYDQSHYTELALKARTVPVDRAKLPNGRRN